VRPVVEAEQVATDRQLHLRFDPASWDQSNTVFEGSAWFQIFKLRYDKPLSNFGFRFN